MKRLLLTSVLASASLFGTAQAQELDWWHIWPVDGASGKIYEAYTAEFEAANPGVKINMVQVNDANFFEKLAASIAAGVPPDLFALTYRRLFDFAGNNALAPIDAGAASAMGYDSLDAFKAAWADGSLNAYAFDGELYGVPLQFNTYAWIINADHFREAGLDPATDYPKTWDDVLALGEKLTIRDANGRVTRQAVSFPFAHSAAWALLEYEPVLRELGGSILNADATAGMINSAESIKAMETLKARFDAGITDGPIAKTLDYYNTGFSTGQFSMGIGGNWGIPRWLKNFPDEVNADTFLAIPTPTFADGITATSTTGWAWAVINSSDQKDLAWKFADFLTSQPGRHLAETGDIIPRAGWANTEAAKAIPQAAFWESMLEFSAPLAKMPNYTEISEILKQTLEEILLNGSDIASTLEAANNEINAVLGG